MGDANARYKKLLRDVSTTDRLQYFSDAVFAIALTLLVLDIAVPTLSNPTALQLNDALVEQLPQFLAYLLSFGVIAINWTGHHRKFAVTRDFDGGVVWIDLLLLFLVAFLPFPTSLISEFPGYVTPVVLYAGLVSSISLVQFWLWAYAYHRGYLIDAVDRSIYRMVSRNLFVVPAVFLASIVIALLPFEGAGYWAMYFWIANWPLSIIVRRERRMPANTGKPTLP